MAEAKSIPPSESSTWSAKTDALGRKIRFQYDPLSRLTSKDYGDDGSLEVAFTYDQGSYGLGRLYSMSDGVGITTYGYDANGRTIAESRAITGTGTYTTTYSYYADDLLRTMTYPDGEVVTSTYTTQRLLDSLIGEDAYLAGTAYTAWASRTFRPSGTTCGPTTSTTPPRRPTAA